MSKGTVAVRFTGDTKDLDGAIGNVSRKLGGFGKAAGLALAAGAAGAGVFAVSVGKDAVDAASNLNETVSKARTIFGPAAKDLEKWADSSAKSFGQSKLSALDAAGTFGNLFVQLGIATDKASGMSTAMVELASDFASFHNTSPEEAIGAMTAAFRGEFDAVQRYVPTINAAAVAQEALAMSGKKTAKTLTDQEKALAVQSLLMKGAGDATGDFARTSDGLANQQRILSAQMEDVKAKIGNALLPIMGTLAGFLVNNVIPAFESVGSTVASWWPQIVSAFEKVRAVVERVVRFVGDLLGRFRQDHDNAATGVGSASSKIANILGGLRDTFQSMFEAIRAIVTVAVTVIGEMWDRFGRGLVDNVTAAFGAIATIITGAAQILSGIFDLIKAVLTGKWGEAWDAVKKILSGVWESMKGIVGLQIAAIRIAIESAMGVISMVWAGAWNGLRTFVGDVWEGIKSKVGAAAEWVMNKIDTMLGPLDEIIGRVSRLPGMSGSILNEAQRRALARRASGGPLSAGQVALVGEQGPEIFVPNSAGHVIPNHRLGGAGKTLTIRGINPRDLFTGQQIMDLLYEYQRQNGSLKLKIAT